MDITTVSIQKPDEINFILGQTHFIKPAAPGGDQEMKKSL
jgi:adenosine/AMP kinase